MVRVVITGKFDAPYRACNANVPLGASGVLGSAIRNAFAASPAAEVLALSHTRSGDSLTQLDLLNEAEVEKVFRDFKPNCVVAPRVALYF